MMPLKANELLMPLYRDWDEPELREIFDGESVPNILKIPILGSPKNEAIFWGKRERIIYQLKQGRKDNLLV